MSEENEAQGRFEEVLREAEPHPSAREEALPADLEGEIGDPSGEDDPSDAVPPDDEGPDGTSDPTPEIDDVLGSALDRLEASVTLLLERHGRLVDRCESAEAESSSAREKLARLAQEGLDPDALERKMQDLEEENDRLARHAEHLEERIRGLLARVRYVVEA